MCIGGVNSEAECFEGCGKFVTREISFEVAAHVLGGGVCDGFVEVNDLAGKFVESNALFIGIAEVLGGVGGGGNSEVIDVNGGVDELVVIEPPE